MTEEPDKVSQTMVRWAEGITRESIVLVDGIVQRPPPDQEVVHSTTIHQYEIKIHKVRIFTWSWADVADTSLVARVGLPVRYPSLPSRRRV